MVHSMYAYLDSRNSNDSNNNDFNLYFNSFNLNGGQYLISLDSAIIPNLIYPIRTGYNAILFRENGSGPTLTSTLTSGVYDATTFCSQLKTQLEAVGAETYTVSISSTTKKITIASTGTMELRTTEMSAGMCAILGFGAAELTGYAASITGSLPVRLDNPANDYLIIMMDNISNGSLSSQVVSRSVLEQVPLNQSYGEIVYYENNGDENHSLVDVSTLDSVRIRILDVSGNPVSLPSNCYVWLKLKMVPLYDS